MFNFLHPKSVVSRRPVAVLAVKQSAQAAALPTVLVLSVQTDAQSTPSTSAAALPAAAEGRAPER